MRCCLSEMMFNFFSNEDAMMIMKVFFLKKVWQVFEVQFLQVKFDDRLNDYLMTMTTVTTHNVTKLKCIL